MSVGRPHRFAANRPVSIAVAFGAITMLATCSSSLTRAQTSNPADDTQTTGNSGSSGRDAVRPDNGSAREDDVQTARELFRNATEALSTGRFAEARDLLRRSLDLTPNPGSAFNLAVALRGTGETLESVEVFERLLKGEYGRLSAEQREQALKLRAEARAEVAVLHIVARGEAEIEVRVDGQHIGRVGPSDVLRHPVDPGPHVVTASAPQYETEEHRVELPRGGSERLEIELLADEASRLGTLVVEGVHPEDVLEIVGVGRGTGTLTRRLEPGTYEVRVDGPAGLRESNVTLDAGTRLKVRLEADSGGVLASPWLWTAAGLLVVALAGSAFLLFRETEEDPVSDPVYGVIATLR